MKKFNFIYGIVAAVALILASCGNEQPKFNDDDAFIAFTKSSLSIDEFGESIEVPALLTSLAGLEGSATLEVDTTSTAIEGVHYEIEGEMTLNFTKDAPAQSLKVKVVDNAEFTGDVKLVLNIVSATNVNLGKNTQCTITIADDEHPLQAILGSYAGEFASYFNDVIQGDITLLKDEKDVNTVWINQIVPGTGVDYKVYGTVNEDMTEIRIPVGQATVKSSTNDFKLDGMDAETGALLTAGQYIVAKIYIEDGVTQIVIQDQYYGLQAYDNTTGETVGWYDLIVMSVWTKR